MSGFCNFFDNQLTFISHSACNEESIDVEMQDERGGSYISVMEFISSCSIKPVG